MKALCCETIRQFSSRSVPFYLDLIQGHNFSATRDTRCLSECVSVCAVCLHIREIKDFFFKKQTNKHFRMKTDGQLCCCYLLYRSHTHTLTHNCCSAPQCFSCSLQSTSSCCPPPSGRSRGEVSQSVFMLVFEYCILLFLFKLPLV